MNDTDYNALLPNVYFAGFPRCATTYTIDVLRQHPDVCAACNKEPNYLNWKFFRVGCPQMLSPYRHHSLEDYAKLFDPTKYRIDASITSAFDADCPLRIHQTLGDIKIIFLIRTNLDKYHRSLYKLCLHHSDIKLISYEEFLHNYSDLIDYCSDYQQHIDRFKNIFSQVEIYNVVENDTRDEIRKIANSLNLSEYDYNYNIDVNVYDKLNKPTLINSLKRNIALNFPSLIRKKWSYQRTDPPISDKKINI